MPLKSGGRETSNSLPGVRTTAVAKPFGWFFLTYSLTVFSLAVGTMLWGKIGGDLIVVAMGWPHVLLGLLFNINKMKGADIKSQLSFLGLLVLTLAIWFVHSQVPITAPIYLYFTFHALRDEIFIYHQRTMDYRFRGQVLNRSGWALVIVTALMQTPSIFLHGPGESLGWYVIQSSLIALLVGMVLLRCPRALVEFWPGSRYAAPAYFFIFATVAGLKIARAHNMSAPLAFAFFVIFHYFSWYVFSFEKMSIPSMVLNSAGKFSLIRWISTRTGFVTVITVMNVLSFAGAYIYQIQHFYARFAYEFDLKYFTYFLVFHVTTSFAPKNRINTPKLKVQLDLQQQAS